MPPAPNASMPSEPAAGVWLSEPDERQARLAEALHVDRVADAVARRLYHTPKRRQALRRNRCSSAFMWSFWTRLWSTYCAARLDLDPLEAHGLELEHHQRARHVLQKGLIDLQRDVARRCRMSPSRRCDWISFCATFRAICVSPSRSHAW